METRTMNRTQVQKGIFTGGRFVGTVLLVLVGLFFVKIMTVPIADAAPIQNPGGDPIAAISDGGVVPMHIKAWESETVIIADQAVPLSSSPDSIAEPVLPNEAEPVLPEELGESLEVPSDEKANNGFKSYMDYRAITCPSSKQYEMQQEAWTDELGLRRYGDYYMVALGTFYAQSCGETFRITLDSGFSFDVITGDIKDDKHTDEKHQHRNGVIVEFVVDSKAISKTCRIMGDMSYAGFSGKIESIQKLQAMSA